MYGFDNSCLKEMTADCCRTFTIMNIASYQLQVAMFLDYYFMTLAIHKGPLNFRKLVLSIAMCERPLNFKCELFSQMHS